MKKHESNKRRQILVSITGGVLGATQLPKVWRKPIINSVMLPAHAATTADTGSGALGNTTTAAPITSSITSYSGDLTFNPNTTQLDGPLSDLLSIIVPDANACCSATVGQMCLDTSTAPNYTAQVLVSDGKTSALFSGAGTIGTPPIVLSFESGCDWFGEVRLGVSSVSPTNAEYAVTALDGGNLAIGSLAPGSNCPADPGQCDDG